MDQHLKFTQINVNHDSYCQGLPLKMKVLPVNFLWCMEAGFRQSQLRLLLKRSASC